MKFKLIFCITVVSLLLVSTIVGAEQIKGKIVAVNEEQEILLLKSQGQIKQYQLDFDTMITLNNQEVDLTALNPIAYKSFCQARLKLKADNKIVSIAAFYNTVEIEILRVKNNKIILKNLDTGKTKSYKVNKNVKLIRNNIQVALDQLKKGDCGLAIIGEDNQLLEVVIKHYELSGILSSINPDQNEITINVGSRLKPKYKNISLTNAYIYSAQDRIEFSQLKTDMWAKVDLSSKAKKIVVREI